jgi:hypothetical protein
VSYGARDTNAAPTREMAADIGPLGIRVNAGRRLREIDTAILSPGTDKIVETIPLRRLGAPEEVAKATCHGGARNVSEDGSTICVRSKSPTSPAPNCLPRRSSQRERSRAHQRRPTCLGADWLVIDLAKFYRVQGSKLAQACARSRIQSASEHVDSLSF